MGAKFRTIGVLIVMLTCSAWGQQRFGSLVTFNKILVAFAPLTSSEAEGQIVQSRTYVGKDAIHRVIFNSDGALYFGYDFVVEPAADSKFLVTMKPLSAEGLEKFLTSNTSSMQASGSGGMQGKTVEKAKAAAGTTINSQSSGVGGMIAGIPAAGSSAPIPTNLTISSPQFPPPQLIADGDTVSVDLLFNSRTGVKISDVIRIASSHRIMLSGQAGPSQAGALPDTSTLWAFGFDVVVDGKLVKSMGGGCSGKLIYFTVKGPQRFILSTQPYDGYQFRNAGFVGGNSISFLWSGHNYELICSEPVLEGGGRSGLWVLYDGGPEGTEPDLAGMATAPMGCGATDRIEDMVRRK